jgi:DDE superfamily endonuclease
MLISFVLATVVIESVAYKMSDAASRLYALELDDRPSTLLECTSRDGSVDSARYLLYLQKQHEISILERNLIDERLLDGEREEVPKPRQKKKRSVKSLRPYYFDQDGRAVFLKPKETVWYHLYVSGPALDSKVFHDKFRRRFRLPYDDFRSLLERVKGDEAFGRWRRKDAVGSHPSPIELLLLGTLRYLGRGLTFDDLEEYTAISEETHRVFFHVFIKFGAEVLHPELVKYPVNATEYETHRKEFDVGGLTGAGWSTDATNVIMWRCEHNLKQANTGFKQSHPARTYNLTCNHRKQILYTTKGHPSRWNDKTLAYADEFLTRVRKGEILQDVQFTLLSSNGTVATKYRGGWGIVDNGYHRWSFLQAPAKTHMMRNEERVSQWIESFRKDVECCFGILKGRWRVLKTGIRVEGARAADRIWLTCCALHNLLLESDGLNQEWEGELGNNDPQEIRQLPAAPLAISRLNDNRLRSFGSHQHMEESVREETVRRRLAGLADEQILSDDEEETEIEQDEDGCIFVRTLPYDEFRNRLIDHFTILFNRNKVKWPRSI